MFSDKSDEISILESCYIYSKSDPYFHTLWKWNLLVDAVPTFKHEKSKWFAVEIISELCSIGLMGKKDLFKAVGNEQLYDELCLQHLYDESHKSNPGKKKSQSHVSDNKTLVCVENVLLAKNEEVFEDDTFVNLNSRKKIMEQIANSIAERKHTFISVCNFFHICMI